MSSTFSKKVIEIKGILHKVSKDQDLLNSIKKSIKLISNCLKSGNKILFIGNGGSAAECQHMAAEYVGLLSTKNMRRGIPALALTTDTSFLTAWSNDFTFEEIFSRQIQTLANEGDLIIAYSTSGNSANVIKGLQMGKKLNLKTIIFSGKNCGKAKNISDISILVPSHQTAHIQEIHTIIGHYICEEIEKVI